MRFNKYDIVLVSFPFSDLSEQKKRPAIIIKGLEGENNIVCQVTTKKKKFSKYEVPLNRNQCEGNIRFESFVYVDMIFTLHESLIVSKIGKIKDANVKDKISQKIKDIFFS
jgi:mRNA interferase MazF